jgi:hypothetical protein
MARHDTTDFAGRSEIGLPGLCLKVLCFRQSKVLHSGYWSPRCRGAYAVPARRIVHRAVDQAYRASYRRAVDHVHRAAERVHRAADHVHRAVEPGRRAWPSSLAVEPGRRAWFARDEMHLDGVLAEVCAAAKRLHGPMGGLRERSEGGRSQTLDSLLSD